MTVCLLNNDSGLVLLKNGCVIHVSFRKDRIVLCFDLPKDLLVNFCKGARFWSGFRLSRRRCSITRGQRGRSGKAFRCFTNCMI